MAIDGDGDLIRRGLQAELFRRAAQHEPLFCVLAQERADVHAVDANDRP